MSAGWHTVHVRVNDATTGQPTPVRIRFVGPDGEYLAPYGRITDFSTEPGEGMDGNVRLGDKRFAYIDGTCEIRLPPDPITVEISKGPEFIPVQREVTLGPGKLTLRLTVDRWVDLRQEGWYSGDMAAFLLSPHAALLEAAAEDIAVTNLLIMEHRPSRRRPAAIANILAFSGQKPALETAGHLVVVNTNNRHPILGSLGLLNCHRLIFPLAFGWHGDRTDWTLADWCDQCHRKSGLVVWRELWSGFTEFDPVRDGEALADLILGKVDALEVDWLGWCDRGHEIWYNLLDCGFRVPLVGGSDKRGNGCTLGCVRTYARLSPGAALSYAAWIEAVRAGRTFVTNGPLLSLSVNGEGPGGTVTLTPGQRTVRVRAETRGARRLRRLEIVANSKVVASCDATGKPAEAVWEGDLVLPGPCWLAARCRGDALVEISGLQDEIGAHTSPVYVDIPGEPFAGDPAAREKLLEKIQRMGRWAEKDLRFEAEGLRRRLLDIFQDAEQTLSERKPV